MGHTMQFIHRRDADVADPHGLGSYRPIVCVPLLHCLPELVVVLPSYGSADPASVFERTNQMARFILAPGGWHGGWAFDAVGKVRSGLGDEFGAGLERQSATP